MTRRVLLLIGGGHAHVQVLLAWRAQPVADVELCVINAGKLAAYSGMVPGWLAGHYRFDEIAIDVAALAHSVGARFIDGEVVAMATDARSVTLTTGATINFDHASVNIGSTLHAPTFAHARVLSLRPLGGLQQRWDELRGQPRPARVIAAGGGPAAVESLLSVLHRLRQDPRVDVQADARSAKEASITEALLVTTGEHILPGHAPGARRAVMAALDAAGVRVQTRTDATAVVTRPGDVVLWATGAQAHAWPSSSPLATDAQGFIRIDSRLRSVSHPWVSAVGDCAAWSTPLPKAGVVAVHMGPVLARNLNAALAGNEAGLQDFVPKPRQLALIATGPRHAVASWGGWSAQGKWVWRWKDHIDRAFVRRFEAR